MGVIPAGTPVSAWRRRAWHSGCAGLSWAAQAGSTMTAQRASSFHPGKDYWIFTLPVIQCTQTVWIIFF
jgi:hypothetical protein